jgi:hypothetical protein
MIRGVTCIRLILPGRSSPCSQSCRYFKPSSTQIKVINQEDQAMTRDQLQILENQLVANCQYKGIQPTLHKLLENLFEGKNLDAILKEMLE